MPIPEERILLFDVLTCLDKGAAERDEIPGKAGSITKGDEVVKTFSHE